MAPCRSSSSFGQSSWPRTGGGNEACREEKNREETSHPRIRTRINPRISQAADIDVPLFLDLWAPKSSLEEAESD